MTSDPERAVVCSGLRAEGGGLGLDRFLRPVCIRLGVCVRDVAVWMRLYLDGLLPGVEIFLLELEPRADCTITGAVVSKRPEIKPSGHSPLLEWFQI